MPEEKISYRDMEWVARTKEAYRVEDMKRSHVRNALQWCLRREPMNIELTKDGHTYTEWITAFTVRLLDPDLGE